MGEAVTNAELIEDIEKWREKFNDAYAFAALAVQGDEDRDTITAITTILEAQQEVINRLLILAKGQQKMIEVLCSTVDQHADIISGNYD
jgi:hypothetical protein